MEPSSTIHKPCSNLLHHHLVESSPAKQGFTPGHEKSLPSYQAWDTKNPLRRWELITSTGPITADPLPASSGWWSRSHLINVSHHMSLLTTNICHISGGQIVGGSGLVHKAQGGHTPWLCGRTSLNPKNYKWKINLATWKSLLLRLGHYTESL